MVCETSLSAAEKTKTNNNNKLPLFVILVQNDFFISLKVLVTAVIIFIQSHPILYNY